VEGYGAQSSEDLSVSTDVLVRRCRCNGIKTVSNDCVFRAAAGFELGGVILSASI
jgi:hypothetical protein